MAKSYGLTMKGSFVLEKVATLPSWSSADEGRMVYNQEDKELYMGTNTQWIKKKSSGYGAAITSFNDNDGLANGNVYFIDTSSGSLTGILPASPSIGEEIAIYDNNSAFNDHPFYVNGNGKNIMGATSLTLNDANMFCSLIYNGTQWIKDIGGSASSDITENSFDTSDFLVSGGLIYTKESGLDHDNLSNLQGGITNEYYHLSNVQHTDLTDNGDCTIHYHTSDRNRSNHTGTQTASTISDFDVEVSNNSSVIANTNKNSYPSGDQTKVNYITITQAVNLDTIKSDVTTNNAKISFDSASSTKLNGIEDNATADQTASEILSLVKTVDGTGSGLDADTVDSLQGSELILIDGSRAFTGTVAGITPINTTDFSTKGYVDGLINGLDWQEAILDKDLNTPPSSPATGDRYIVSYPQASATGDWAGHDNEIAEWNGSAWDYTTVTNGMAVWIQDEDIQYNWNGSAWVKFGSTITHNNTSGIQGGITDEYYHLSANEHTDLTNNGDCTIHYHTSDRNLNNATGVLPSDTTHGTRGGGNLHANATETVNGFMSSSDKTKLDNVETNATAYNKWLINTSNFSAIVKKKYIVDTTSAAVTATLPATANNGEGIEFSDGGDFSTNNLIIARNGNTIEGLSEDMTVDTKSVSFELVFYNNNWILA